MTITDLKASLDYLFAAQLTGFIWGNAGIGKTSIVKQYAEKKGYKFFALYLGTQSDTGDILGLQDFVKDENGQSVATAFAMPTWIKEAIDYCNDNPDSGAVIFLDEFNRARRDILQGMFSLALDKKFHTVQLPKNCHLIAAGNPDVDGYDVTDTNETALMARFVHIKLEPTFQEWLDFAKGNEFDGSIVNFLKNQPNLLEQEHGEFSLPVKLDRRSWERLNRLFKLNTPSNILEQLAYGIVGVEATAAYMQFLKEQNDKPLSGEEVLNGERLKDLERWSDPANTLGSLLNVTIENVKEYLQKLDEPNKDLAYNKPPIFVMTETQQANLFKFLFLLPKDIGYKFCMFLGTGKILHVCKDFGVNPKYEKQLCDYVLELRQYSKKNEEKK